MYSERRKTLELWLFSGTAIAVSGVTVFTAIGGWYVHHAPKGDTGLNPLLPRSQWFGPQGAEGIPRLSRRRRRQPVNPHATTHTHTHTHSGSAHRGKKEYHASPEGDADNPSIPHATAHTHTHSATVCGLHVRTPEQSRSPKQGTERVAPCID